jgi:hypothetical protein
LTIDAWLACQAKPADAQRPNWLSNRADRLVARESGGPFLETDVQEVRLGMACEQAGLPMDAIASAVRAGRCRSRS